MEEPVNQPTLIHTLVVDARQITLELVVKFASQAQVQVLTAATVK